MCCCLISDDPFDPDSEEDDEPETGNIKIIDMLIFSENNVIYYLFSLFTSFLSMFSVYYYLYIVANRLHTQTDHAMIFGYEPYLFVTMLMEIIFFTDMLLQLFREYTPVGQGELSKPVKRWSQIILHYLKTDFIWDFIPLIPLQLLTMQRRRENLFFLIKLLRIRKGMKFLDVI